MPPLSLDHIVETERCRLRVPSEADIPATFEASREPGFCDGMRWDPPATMEELKVPLGHILDAWLAGRAYSFTITRKSDAAFLGRISIRRIAASDRWNLGFWLHPKHQGAGFMTEAGNAILRLGFEVLGAREIEACHAAWNQRSEAVLRNLGMSFVEHIAQGFKKRGEWIPENRMSRSVSSWPVPSGRSAREP